MAELSPMMQQYLEIKKQHKDEILFYRIGDFYEMFFDDALTASKELDLTLTGKQCGLEERAPMCGVPFHSYEGYVARLIAKGYKVVPAYVHKRSYCFAAVLCLAVKIICERAALQNVPAVYYKRIAILFEAGNAVGKSRGYAAARGVVDG